MAGGLHGVLLAAGAGRRMGRPKALLRMPDGTPWVARATGALLDGGCEAVTVVLGAEAATVRDLVPARAGVTTAYAEGWAGGMSASLVTGLESLRDSTARAAVVLLVDLPDVGAPVVRRVCEAAGDGSDVLGRAAYDGRPGHPVVIGRDHWADVIASAGGDAGARGYLAGHRVRLVECSDLATGQDVDTLPSGQ